MGASEIRSKLIEMNIPYVEETFLDDFWGIRFIFASRKTAVQVQKLLPKVYVQAHFKRWAISVF
jgi:hypothetical protein